MEGLSDFERAVLDKLLNGDHPVLVALRSQAEEARLASREYTGVGFYCDFEVPSDAAVSPEREFELGDVNAVVSDLEYGAGFLLFVRDGRLDFLEGFSYDEPWPKEIRSFELTYEKEPRPLPFPNPSEAAGGT